MSLGSDLAPHLPLLRRFARSALGNQEAGDRIVRATLDRLVDDPAVFPPDVYPRLGLYRLFLLTLDATDERHGIVAGDLNEETAHRRLGALEADARIALLLTAMEGFSTEDAAYLLNRSEEETDQLISRALAEVDRQTHARVLIVEDDPLIAMDLESIVRDLGHDVAGVATTRAEAVALAREGRVGLVLMDIQLADDSSGIDAWNDIRAFSTAPGIFITAYPERLLTGERPEPTFLITKPFQRSTVKAAISQALFFDHETVPVEDDALAAAAPLDSPSPYPSNPDDLGALANEDLAARAGPIDVAIVSGQIRRAGSTPVVSDLPAEDIDALRELHLVTAVQLTEELARSNAARPLLRRLEGVLRALEPPLDDRRALLLGVQIDGLRRVFATTRSDLLDETAADVDAFIVDIHKLARRFQTFVRFDAGAPAAEPLAGEHRDLLVQASRVIEAAPDTVVEPAVRDELADVRSGAEESGDPVSDLALTRSIGNILRAIGRAALKAGDEAGTKALSTFSDQVGEGVGNLMFQLAQGGVLLALAYFLPGELKFLAVLVALGRRSGG